MRHQAVVVCALVAFLIVVMGKPVYATSCNTPDVTTQEPFGGQCGLTCEGQFPLVTTDGIDVNIVLTCDSTVVAAAGGALCIGNDIPAMQCDAFGTSAPTFGTSCTCKSTGLVLDGYCEC
jgi:hypothetical protein